MPDTTNPRDEELREKLKVIYRKNQDDGGTFYHEAATDDIMQLIQEHDATREREIRIDIQNEGHFFTHKDMKGGAIDYGFYHFCKCGYKANGQDELQGHIAWHIGTLTNPNQQTGEK